MPPVWNTGMWGVPVPGQLITPTMAEYFGIAPRFMDGINIGSSAVEAHVAHAAIAIAAGRGLRARTAPGVRRAHCAQHPRRRSALRPPPRIYGISLLIEAVRQLRGECGEHRVANARRALVHGTGGTPSSGATYLHPGQSLTGIRSTRVEPS